MRVLIITENDPIYIYKFFSLFLNKIDAKKIDLVGISVLKPFNMSIISTGLRVFNFYGKDFFLILKKYIKSKIYNKNLNSLINQKKIKLINTNSINSEEYINKITKLNIDLIVSVACPEILKSKIINIPKICALNVHCGKLPNYRGMMPTFWQMLKKEKYITITIHEIIEQLDLGEIVEEMKFPLRKIDSLDRVMSGTKEESARLLIKVLNSISETKKKPKTFPLDLSKSKLFRFPSKKDVREFRKIGHRLI